MSTLLAGTLFLLIQDEPGPEFHAQLNMPLHGTVYQERLYGFFSDKASDTSIFSIFIAKPEKKTSRQIAPECILDLHFFNRHHVKYGAIWFATGPSLVCRLPVDDLHLFDPFNEPRLEQFKKKYPAPEPYLGNLICWGFQALPYKYYNLRAKENGNKGFDFRPAKGVAGIDFAPISGNSCRVFYFPKKTNKLETWETHARFDPKKQIWEVVADERNFEAFDSTFVEDYFAFLQKNHYYFVTQSGKLYHAPPAKKGEKSRKMTALWDDPQRPINAIIEDADRDKVFLFAKHKKDAKRGYYFEMKSATTFETFDPTKLERVNIEGRAKTLLELWPLVGPQAKKKAS
ncbi:MAG: hypothetical protein HYX68_05580 [Planctomycetes bacterium]|nr:hypothetical protein [Planctomycetota bacterium]